MHRLALRALFVAAAFPAFATPPVAPEVVYDAAPKQILFDWNYVPRANLYEIWFRANPGAAWSKMGERPSWYPHRDMNVSAHLLDWTGMRWDIRACNPSGCSPPGSLDIGSTVVNTVGYVKPVTPQTNGAFGAALDVAEDGKTFVVLEPRYHTGLPAGQNMVVAHIFKPVNGRWQTLVGLSAGVNASAGATVSISGDGAAIAIGLPAESYAIGSAAPAEHGAVYIFRYTGEGWAFERRLTPVESDGLHAGAFTKLSDDGRTLAYSIATSTHEGLESYRRNGSGDWVRMQPLEAPSPHDQVDYGLGGDGKALFVRTRTGSSVETRAYGFAFHELISYVAETVPSRCELSSFDVDTTGNQFVSGVRPALVAESAYDPANWKPRVTVFRRAGTEYEPVAVLAPSRFQPTSYAKRSLFGDRIAFSSQGTYLAVYDPHDAQGHNGVQPPPSAMGTQPPRGSVYLFEKHGTGYRERRHIGANGGSPDWVDGQGIFGPMAFGNDGKTFLVGSPTEDGGIVNKKSIKRAGDAEAHDTSKPDAGAAWLY